MGRGEIVTYGERTRAYRNIRVNEWKSSCHILHTNERVRRRQLSLAISPVRAFYLRTIDIYAN